MKFDNKFILACDWLQLHVKHREDFLDFSPYFRFKRTGQSKVFKDIYEIMDLSGNFIATYCTKAQECIMPESEGVLKIENKQLYIHENLKDWVKDTLHKLGFKFIGITRFDIAFDFQKFYMDMEPKQVITNYVTGKYLRTVHRKSKFKAGVYFEQKGTEIDMQTLSMGSKHSNIHTKMYNKTEELRGNLKPWIKQGHNDYFDNDCDVWRLEFSLFSMTAFFKGEGKDFNFHSLEVLDLVNMYGIFIGLFKKYFRFKNNKGEARLTRMKDVVLWHFDLSFTELKKIALNPVVRESSRSERIFIKKLDTLNKGLREFDESFDWTAKDMIGKIINLYQLGEWAKDQGIDFDTSQDQYVNNISEFQKINPVFISEKLKENFELAMMEQDAREWIKVN